jgi:mitochondrial fission protein ELM1
VPPRVWALVSDHAGDSAQVLALAEELGLPFETRTVRYTWRKRLPGNDGRVSLLSIDRQSREQLVPPWPDLLIIVGPRSQPIGRFVKRASNGHTKLVLIGRLRASAKAFDLVFDTRQYRLLDAPNVRLLPIAMSRSRSPIEPTDEERSWLSALPRPRLLLMVGGPIRYWDITPDHIGNVVAQLLLRSERLGGSLIVNGSPRTPPKVIARLRGLLASATNASLAEGMPRFHILVHDADELFPTGDSVSMISESVVSGKPVGIVPMKRTLSGRMLLGQGDVARRPFRDLRRFWAYLRRHRLAGTIEEPIAAQIDNPVIAAAAEVHELLRSRE